MNVINEYKIINITETGFLKSIKKTFEKPKDHDPLFDESIYHILDTNEGVYLQITIAETKSYTRLWLYDFEKQYFFIDKKKYKYSLD